MFEDSRGFVFEPTKVPKGMTDFRLAFVKETEPDNVNYPSHYTTGTIEVADFIADKDLNFFRGSVVKYVVRAGIKDPAKEVEDLEKAIWYLNREIRLVKEKNQPQVSHTL